MNEKILKWAKKYKAVQMLGGKCEICGNNNLFHLVFHHKDGIEKEYKVSEIRSRRWSIIEKEIRKCRLLCHNCHNKIHEKNSIDLSSRNIKGNKKLYLEIKGIYGCELCGYNECNNSLTFHHVDSSTKLFSMRDIIDEFSSITEISNQIIEEINKCQILCTNCHIFLHSDSDFYEKYKSEIIEKSENIREIQPKIDRELVKELYLIKGMKQIEIVRYLNCAKGTISDIIKELNIKK